MSGRDRLMPFAEQRVLENAAFVLGLVPTSVQAVLLPVWSVEVRATVTEGRPYELVDRFVERAIGVGGLGSAGEIAAFLALDPALVRQALAFLTAIEHVTDVGGRVVLTELGRRSMRDGTRYTVVRGDRRRLYFDGFRSRPLTAAHYTSSAVTFVPQGGTAPRHHGSVVRRLDSPGFRDDAVTELANHRDRARFNLPPGIENPERVGEPEKVHLPVYAVRAVEDDGRVRHLVYTPAHDGEHDPDLSAVCEETPAFVADLWSAETGVVSGVAEKIRRWLSRRNLAQYEPEWDRRHGAWRVTLPPGVFSAPDGLGLARVGTYQVLGGGPFFQLWCADRDTRAWALVERLDSSLAARLRDGPDAVRARVDALNRQLEIRPPAPLAVLTRAAEQKGMHRLARILRQTEETIKKEQR
ncbi:hypothetical protein ACIBVL_41250 [Streptomyces sp. NPDC049687]|uniref:hypothetical protein n=1 Tax=Streptomyces sp. NPDC049687 TaxID=3365596 RepID=UPI0037AE4120